MKHLIVMLTVALIAAGGAHAQPSKKGTSVTYPHFVLSSVPQPNASGAQPALFLGGRIEKGKKEQFGVMLANTQQPVIEFLGADNAVIKAVTAADLLGRTSAGVRLVRSMANEAGTHAEAVYEISGAQGKSELAIRSLAAIGRESKTRTVMSFSIKGAPAGVASVRMSLPVEGQAAALGNGFVVASKTQAAAFAASVFPKPGSLTAGKNIVSFSMPFAAEPAGAEEPFAWMVVEGSSASNAGASMNEAVAAAKGNGEYSARPNVVIVTAASKLTTQPNDTVTYSIVCTNVGLGSAADIVVNNPIPAGTAFVEGSAEGKGTQIGIDRGKAPAPQAAPARSVSWKFTEPLKPGAEKTVSFKVVVR